MSLNLTSGVGLMLVLVVIVFVVLIAFKGPARLYEGKWKGGSARLPCLANNRCPVGQKCSGGFCSEGFMAPITQSTDMSSCSAPQCAGINAPCARTGAPCGEGTFCQGNRCIPIAPSNQGAAYNQIGNLLD